LGEGTEPLFILSPKNKENAKMARRRGKKRSTRRRRNPIVNPVRKHRKSYRRKNPVFTGGLKGFMGKVEAPLGTAIGIGLTGILLDKVGLNKSNLIKILAPLAGGLALGEITKGNFSKNVANGMLVVGILRAMNAILPENLKVKGLVDGLNGSLGGSVGELVKLPDGSMIDSSLLLNQAPQQIVNGLHGVDYVPLS